MEAKQPVIKKRRTLSKKMRWGLRAGVFVLSLMLSCAGGEVFLRYFHVVESISLADKNGRSIYVANTDLGFALRPNATAALRRLEFSIEVKTNSQGWRDDEFALPPDPREFVIAGLGDSFAIGHGVDVENSFYQVSEHLLRRKFPNVRIHNLALHGYSQKQHVRQIELARQLGAKVVVIAVCTQNDVFENDGILLRQLDSEGNRTDKGPDERLPELEQSPPNWLHRNSHLYRFFRYRILSLPDDPHLGISAWYILDGTRADPDPRTAHALQTTDTLLRDILQQCDQFGLKLAIVSIPSAWECSEEKFQAALDYYHLAPNGMDRRRITEFYKSFAENHGIPFLDMIEVLEKKSRSPENYFFPMDRHLNAKGQKAVGEALASFLAPYVEDFKTSQTLNRRQ